MATECSIGECVKPVFARSWCSMHYTRWKRLGDPEALGQRNYSDGCKACVACGARKPLNEFTRTNDPCRPCVAAAMRRRRAVSPDYVPVARSVGVCDHCGAEFEADKRRNRYCSRACFEAHRWIAQSPDRHRRRALLYGVGYEHIPRDEILARDNWTCGICTEPIDPSLVYPDRWSASLDHIVPLARGGAHSRDNLQAAHLTCNARKGARVPEGVC